GLQGMLLGAEPESYLGFPSTNRYDPAKMGRWQRLTTEFETPERTARCQLSLGTGTTAPVEIDAYLDDVVLQPIQRLSALETYRLNPLPPVLEKVRHQHPRLFFNAQRVALLREALLREAIKTTHRTIWQEVRAEADEAVHSGPPAYIKPDDSGSPQTGNEQLWQGDVGNAMPMLALAYLLSGEQKYLDGARDWALASCRYPTWGLDAGGVWDGLDMAAANQLCGLALVYDWCYDDLGAATRRTIRETLIRRASAMFMADVAGIAWWHDSYLQNHLWVNSYGLAAAGFALFDEVGEATAWIGWPLESLRRTMTALGPDGASHEGMAYWGVGVEYLLKFMHLARDLLGVNLYNHAWWRNTAAYGQYLMLPRNSWTKQNHIVDFADCPRRHWCGPDYLLRALAHEYRDGYAQWLAHEIDDSNIDNPLRRWHNFLWFDPDIAPKPPRDRPTLRHFADMEIVSARSDWSGSESLVVFKCGPFIGHHAIQKFNRDLGGIHVHPDANHFVLFGAGEWLIRDDGYNPKWTGQHNTLLIDGRGQLGEGKSSFNANEPLGVKARPRVLRAAAGAELDHITGDATEAYPRELGLKRYRRHLLFLKPDVLIIVDDIALDQPRALELRFHPESTQAERDGAAFLARGKQAVLRMEPLTVEGVNVTVGDVAEQSRGGKKERSMFALRCSTQRAQWRNAVALSWSKVGGEPVKVTLQKSDDRWTFAVGKRAVVFDWRAGQAHVRE
ncbi:MAG TPA: DUF4962 domain-containing protein, partial [Abditibacteriaceae bacterium]|nr:DUF4962 domain-containing protein [Abditibacteriaceae bacterium]